MRFITILVSVGTVGILTYGLNQTMSRSSDSNPQEVTTTQVYQYRDDEGTPLYTDQKPAPSENVNTRKYRSDTNVSRTEPDPAEELLPEKQAPVGKAPVSNPYHPERIKQLYEDAQAVKKTMENRVEQIDAALEQQSQP